ncbi:MAG: putative Ig domain-containing protein [Verrucomicrobiaceae bacterium]
MKSFRRFSRRAWPLHVWLMLSMLLWPVPTVRSYWTDSNQDGVKEWVDEAGLDPSWWDADSDSDGLTNAQEAVYGSDPYAKDSDRDGLSDLVERDYTPPSAPFDPWSWDTDGDGYSDHDEYYLLIQGSPLVVHYPSLGGIYYDYRDADGDGVLNYEDSDPVNMDRDGDGLRNWEDSWMDDASNGYVPPADDPGVYIGGTWYPSGTLDSDSDGIPDHLDPFAWGSFWYNGIEYGGSWSDRDADGIPDSADTYPDGSYWYEGVEYGGMWSDMDGDGIPDPADPSPVYVESYWYGGTEYFGTWQDSDSDGIPEPADEYPWDAWNGQPHFNYNGTEYPGESVDRDGDGVPDAADSWPDDPENGADDDNDGLCNYDERTQHFTDPHDVDSDNDWLTDYEELYFFHTNPKAPRSALASGQSLLDGQIHLGADADGDELPDVLEDYYASLGYGLDKNDPADGAGDLDSDGCTNAEAFTFGWSLIANRGTYDQDADGIDDAVEAYWAAVYPGSMDKTVFEDAVADHDQDGLMNYEEVVRHNVNGWLLPADPGDAYSLIRSQGYEVVPGVTPNDGQFMRWWWDVSRPDYGGTVDGTPVPADAALRDVTDVDPEPNGIPDGYERWVAAHGEGSNAARAILADEDGDGMPNVWEYRYGLNLRGPQDATINPDGDSLTNLQEFQAGRDPWVDDDAPPDDLLLHGSLPAEGAIGVSYTGNLSASGGKAPLVFTVSSGDLPPGLALNPATGQVTGTPTQDGSFNVFITVTDALGTTAVSSWGITVAGLEISTASLPVAYLGRTYNASINARFGSSPYQFSLVYPSELPHGYGMDSAGKITSDGFVDPLFPVVAGDYPFDVQVWDSSGRTTTKTLTLTLEEPPPPPALTFTSMALPPGTVAWDYHAQVPVTGVQGGAAYGLVGAPAWLAVNGSGHLSGKPTATGQFTFDVWVQDEIWDPNTGMNRRAVQTMSLSVAPYLPAHVTIISGNLQIGRANATFDPIVVMVTDDNGAAMPGIPVTALGITILTDTTGLATFTLPAFGNVGAQEVEVASPAEAATVHFYTYDPPGTGQPPLSSDVPKPSAPEMKPQVAQPEVQLECRYVSTSSGTIEAQWNEAWVYFVDMLKVWQLVPGVPVPDVNKSGLKWATSDGREGPPPDDVPSLESITTWFPGNPAAMYSIAADKTGVLEGVPNPGGTGPATPIPPNVESHPLYGNWGGTQKGFEETQVADVRLTHTSGSGSGEVKQTFLEIVEEDGQITSATPITLSTSDSQPHRLEAPKPPTGKRNKKYLLPVDIAVVFGFQWENSGRQRLNAKLQARAEQTIVNGNTSTFLIRAAGANGQQGKLWVVQTARDEAAIKSALSSVPYVAFEGHANMGIGPAFDSAGITKISDFTNFGNPQAAINWDFMVEEEGYSNFNTITDSEIPTSVANYNVLPAKINLVRYPNNEGVAPGSNFTVHGPAWWNLWLMARYHFTQGSHGSKRLVVNAGKADLPSLGYQTFFYNACNTARDFGEVFQHGRVFHSNVSIYPDGNLAHGSATDKFVFGVIDGQAEGDMLKSMNDTQIGLPEIDPNKPSYRVVQY